MPIPVLRTAGLAVGVIARLRRLGSALLRRRSLAAIGQLDDRLLRDIGLTRHDLWCARAEPLFRDPTITLVGRAHDRQVAARAAARDAQAMAELRLRWSSESRTA